MNGMTLDPDDSPIQLRCYCGDDPMIVDMLLMLLEDRQRGLARRYFPDNQVLLQLGPKTVPQWVWNEYYRLEGEIFRLKQVMVVHKILTAAEVPGNAPDSPMIDEEEAARLMKRTPKHLGNLRRDNLIPRNLYQQLTPGGKVMFYKEKYVAWLANKSNSPKD